MIFEPLKVPSGVDAEVRRAFQAIQLQLIQLQGLSSGLIQGGDFVVNPTGEPVTVASGSYVLSDTSAVVDP